MQHLRLSFLWHPPTLRSLLPNPNRDIHHPQEQIHVPLTYHPSPLLPTGFVSLACALTQEKLSHSLFYSLLISFPLPLTEYLWVLSFIHTAKSCPITTQPPHILHFTYTQIALYFSSCLNTACKTHMQNHTYILPPTCHLLFCFPVPTHSTPAPLNAISAWGSWQHDSAKVSDAHMFHPKREEAAVIHILPHAGYFLLLAILS